VCGWQATSGLAADAAAVVEAAEVVGEAAAVHVVEHRAVAVVHAGACRVVAEEHAPRHALPPCHGRDRRRFGVRVAVPAVALRATGHQRVDCRRLVDQPAALETGPAQEIGLAQETLPIGQRPGRAVALVQVPALALGPARARGLEQVLEALRVHDRADEDRVVASYPTSLICQMPAVATSDAATSVEVDQGVD